MATAAQSTANILSTLLSSTNQVTNLNVGSLVRSIADGVGAECARIDQEILDTAKQTVLNAPYQIWQITPLSAVASVYLLQFSNTTGNPISIAQGTQATIPNSALIWQTQSAVTIPAGTSNNPGTVTVTAVCTITGSQTNVPVNSITQLLVPISGVSVTNPSAQPVISGADAETQTQTQARLANQTASIHRGDSKAVELGALTAYISDSNGNMVEYVAKAKSVDYIPGKAIVYCINNSGALSNTLQTQTQNVVDGYTDASGVAHIGYKAAGIFATVTQALVNPVSVSVQILSQSWTTLFNIQSQIQAAIVAFFDALDIQQKFSTGALITAIRKVPGVADVDVISPAVSLSGIPNVINPAAAPTLTAVTTTPATGLAAGAYYVAYSYTNIWGETLTSTSASVTLTAGQAIQIGAITLPSGATGVNYYLSTTAGSSTLGFDASGTGVQVNLTTLPASGANPVPSTSTALIYGNLYTLSGTPIISQMSS